MEERTLQTNTTGNWKTRILLIGAVLGALVGAAAAYLYIQNSQEDGPPEISAGEGIKLGVLVFGMLRSIASLGEGK